MSRKPAAFSQQPRGHVTLPYHSVGLLQYVSCSSEAANGSTGVLVVYCMSRQSIEVPNEVDLPKSSYSLGGTFTCI